ncbi:hypothetical protein GCM10023195_87800 [Actinoallomurus liliacearum]|uniref:DUF4365 domain-containing protein n=1 Tax=Actinoallomurus liliacearum TaxID=1080073 RepID=A0ABP8U1K7_9ACTN
MPKIPNSRKASRAAVNALRTLLEQHDHIVDEVPGQNDFGEDLWVRFTVDRNLTGDLIYIQVKGGHSYRRAKGYSVSVGRHGDTWADGNVPVICVIHDPDKDALYWANATQQLNAARRQRRSLRSIKVSAKDCLDDASMADFVARVRHYISRYQGNRAVRTQLSDMTGVEFGPSDIVRHFVNVYGEDLVFWQRRGEGYATLLHSDLDWEPVYIGPEMLHADALTGLGLGPTPAIGGIILNMAEAMWLAACFEATDWARESTPGQERIKPRVEVCDNYVSHRIKHRLLSAPDAITRSIEIFKSKGGADPGVLDEIQRLGSNARVVEEARTASWEKWEDLSPEARKLAAIYLVEDVGIGAPSLPIDRQFEISWRWNRPWKESDFSARSGQPSTRLTPDREIVRAHDLVVGDRIYWRNDDSSEERRLVSDIWRSEKTPMAICLRFDARDVGDTFWLGEQFARADCAAAESPDARRDILAFVPDLTEAKPQVMAIVDRGNGLNVEPIEIVDWPHEALAICNMLNAPDAIFEISGLWYSLPVGVRVSLEQARERMVGGDNERHELALLSVAQLDLPELPDREADIDWAQLFPSAGCPEEGCPYCDGCPGHAEKVEGERGVNQCAPGGSCSCQTTDLKPDDEPCDCMFMVIGPRWAAAIYRELADIAEILCEQAEDLMWGVEGGYVGFPRSLCAQPPQFYVRLAQTCASLCGELAEGRIPIPRTTAEYLMLDEAVTSYLAGWTGRDGLQIDEMKQELAHLPEAHGDFDLDALWMFQSVDSDWVEIAQSETVYEPYSMDRIFDELPGASLWS